MGLTPVAQKLIPWCVFPRHGASLAIVGELINTGSLYRHKREEKEKTAGTTKQTETWYKHGSNACSVIQASTGVGVAKPAQTPKMARDVGKRYRWTARE
jgi:hypothetical protein